MYRHFVTIISRLQNIHCPENMYILPIRFTLQITLELGE